MLLAGAARADDNAQTFHRDLVGRQWVVVSDQAGSFPAAMIFIGRTADAVAIYTRELADRQDRQL